MPSSSLDLRREFPWLNKYPIDITTTAFTMETDAMFKVKKLRIGLNCHLMFLGREYSGKTVTGVPDQKGLEFAANFVLRK